VGPTDKEEEYSMILEGGTSGRGCASRREAHQLGNIFVVPLAGIKMGRLSPAARSAVRQSLYREGTPRAKKWKKVPIR